MLLRVVDIETTGGSPPAEVIELGWVDLVLTAEGWGASQPQSRLFRPLNGIPAENKAIHHLTENQFSLEMTPCSSSLLQTILMENEPNALIAHNADFERAFIGTDITGDLPWVCTYKAALRMWPEAPRHSNQVLRYWLNLNLDSEMAMPPHRAGPDAFVTANIMIKILQLASLTDLIDWTSQPRRPSKIYFGRHRGQAWSNIPSDYLKWLALQAEIDAEAKLCASHELIRRENQATSRLHNLGST